MPANRTRAGKPADVLQVEICAATVSLALAELQEVAGRLGNATGELWREAGGKLRETLDEALATHRQSWPPE